MPVPKSSSHNNAAGTARGGRRGNMPTKQPDLSTQIALLTQKVTEFIEASRSSQHDHEERIRALEAGQKTLIETLAKIDGKLDKEIVILDGKIATVKERLGIFSSLQVILTSAVGAFLAWRK